MLGKGKWRAEDNTWCWTPGLVVFVNAGERNFNTSWKYKHTGRADRRTDEMNTKQTRLPRKTEWLNKHYSRVVGQERKPAASSSREAGCASQHWGLSGSALVNRTSENTSSWAHERWTHLLPVTITTPGRPLPSPPPLSVLWLVRYLISVVTTRHLQANGHN